MNSIELDSEYTALVARATSLGPVIDAETYATLGELVVSGKQFIKAVEEHHNPIIASAHETHRMACEAKNRLIKPVEAFVRDSERQRGVWRRAEEERERTARLKAQEKERTRAESALVNEAAAAEAAGEPELAEAIINLPVEPRPVTVPSAVPKVAGTRRTEVWSAEFHDLLALCRAIADGKAPTTWVLPNQAYGNSQAKHMRSTLSVPGVKAVVEYRG